MENVLKALCYVQDRQSKRPVRPNSEADLRRSKFIHNAVEKYTNDLVIGVVVNHKDLSAECEIRNAYTTSQHIKCLLHTWSRPISILSPWIREHLALAIRHSMLLRNEDLVQMNLADCFMMQISNRQYLCDASWQDQPKRSHPVWVCSKASRCPPLQYWCLWLLYV